MKLVAEPPRGDPQRRGGRGAAAGRAGRAGPAGRDRGRERRGRRLEDAAGARSPDGQRRVRRHDAGRQLRQGHRHHRAARQHPRLPGAAARRVRPAVPDDARERPGRPRHRRRLRRAGQRRQSRRARRSATCTSVLRWVSGCASTSSTLRSRLRHRVLVDVQVRRGRHVAAQAVRRPRASREAGRPPGCHPASAPQLVADEALGAVRGRASAGSPGRPRRARGRASRATYPPPCGWPPPPRPAPGSRGSPRSRAPGSPRRRRRADRLQAGADRRGLGRPGGRPAEPDDAGAQLARQGQRVPGAGGVGHPDREPAGRPSAMAGSSTARWCRSRE